MFRVIMQGTYDLIENVLRRAANSDNVRSLYFSTLMERLIFRSNFTI